MGNIMKQHSILFTLFIPFTVLFILAFAIFMSYFIITESDKAKTDSFITMQNNAITISDNLDAEVTKLDTVSQNIIYSSILKEEFSDYIEYQQSGRGTDAERLHNRETISDLLISMIGPNTPVNQVYLYSLQAGGIGAGLNNTDLQEAVSNKIWYDPVISSAGSKVIYCGEDPAISKYLSSDKNQRYLSLCRVFYSATNVPLGIIEVKKSFEAISNMIEGYQYSFSEKIYIFDSEGNMIYPADDLSEGKQYYEAVMSQNAENIDGDHIIYYNDAYLLAQTSDYTGFSTVVAVDQNQLLAPIRSYLFTNLGLLFFIMLSIIVLSFFIARFISRPLNRIYLNLKNFDITQDDSTEFFQVDTHITELNALYDAFLKMQNKVKLSINRELTLQQREMQARMLALQAQMNPHFLYNSLSTIQAMADEGMDRQIMDMCQSMSRILRYISSDKEQLVTVDQEIKYTIDFLKCMKARFDDDLIYNIVIPEELRNVRIPKLCLQLIVENSIKFMTKEKSPPWKINIKGSYNEQYWEIRVQDNGPGFQEDELRMLQEKIEQINQTGVLPNLELNGMGLMNIYIRLKLLYGGEHIFRLENADEPGGAIVTIGGWKENE